MLMYRKYEKTVILRVSLWFNWLNLVTSNLQLSNESTLRIQDKWSFSVTEKDFFYFQINNS